MTDNVNTNETIDKETFEKQKAFFKENLIKQFKEQESGFDNICIDKVENLLNYHGQECTDMQSYVRALHAYLTNPGTRFIDADTAKQLYLTEDFCKKYIEQTQDFVGDFSKLPFEQQKEIVKSSLLKNAKNNGVSQSALKEIEETCDKYDNEEITDIDSYLSKMYQWASYKGPIIFDATKDNSGYWPAMEFLEKNLKPALAYTNFPQPPEPVVEEKKEFSTTSKDHKVRIEQWMEHVGLGDKSQELIDKYGLDNAYAIVQNSMKAPANMTKATDGKFRGSKGTINYFLENDVERDRLIQIPGMDLKTVHESLVSVGKAKKIETPNTSTKLNIEAQEIVLPEKIDAIPMYNLSELDMQKVKYTAAMLDELKLDGIRDKKIDKEIMHAFEKAMENDASDIKTWSGNFRFHLIDELNLEGRAYDSSKDEYSKLILPLVEGSDKIVEKLDSLPNDNPRYADLVASVNKFNTKNDMKSQKGEIVQNADNQEKVEKVETKVSFREKFKAGRNRVLSYIGLKKKKENENASSDMEKSAEQVRDSENWVEVTASQAIEAPTTDRSYTR